MAKTKNKKTTTSRSSIKSSFAAAAVLASPFITTNANANAIPTTTIEGLINLPPQLAENPKHDVNKVKLFLTNHIDTKVVAPMKGGTFEFFDVEAGGTYVLEIQHPSLHFDSVTVDVGSGGGVKSSSEVTPYLTDYLYGKGAKLKYPLVLAPSQVINYFEEREEFNILSTFKNPMVLMMLVMCGLMYVMPKMQPDINPEEMKKLKKDLKDDDSIQGTVLKKMLGGSS